MNPITLFFTVALAAATSAYSASSYVKRYDSNDHHDSQIHHVDHDSHHDYHHQQPLLIAQPHIAYAPIAPLVHSYSPLSHGYAPAHDDYNHHPSYKFEYGVKDAHTGDHKSQWEHRDGDVVKGEYTLDEADGTKRVVSYTADDHNGFQAVVKKIGHAHHPQVYHHEPQHLYHHEEPYHHGYANSYSKLYVPNHHY